MLRHGYAAKAFSHLMYDHYKQHSKYCLRVYLIYIADFGLFLNKKIFKIVTSYSKMVSQKNNLFT